MRLLCMRGVKGSCLNLGQTGLPFCRHVLLVHVRSRLFLLVVTVNVYFNLVADFATHLRIKRLVYVK